MKLTVFIPNANAGPEYTNAAPAMAGPIKRAVLNTTELRAMALGVLSVDQRINEGKPCRLIETHRKAVEEHEQSEQLSVMAPIAVTTVRSPAASIARTWVINVMRSGEWRSAIAPPSGPITIAGAKSTIAMMPSHVAEWVSSHVSQPTATR